MKLLFVCLGNICRSPVAEAIAKKYVQSQGLNWFIDSAGTNGYHDGENADPRSIKSAAKRGYEVTSLSRQIQTNDFTSFDYIIGMDQKNINTLKAICPEPKLEAKLHLITDFNVATNEAGVPDPYYGTARDFDIVLDILEEACPQLIETIRQGRI